MEPIPRELLTFETEDGKCPFDEWLNGLRDMSARAIIRKRLNRVRLGNLGNTRSLGEGVWELKIDFGPGYRVYYGEDGPRIVVLLVGEIKGHKSGTLKTPKNSGRTTMPKRTKKYDDALMESLKDPQEAAAYLNAHLDDEDSEEMFLLALRDVARAHGFAEVAEQADLGRESLYKALSKDGNPKLSTLKSLLKVVGLKLSVEQEDQEAS